MGMIKIHKILRDLLVFLGIFFLSGNIIYSQDLKYEAYPPELLMNRLQNPGIALTVSSEIADHVMVYLQESPEHYFPSILLSWQYLELSQNYQKSMILLNQVFQWFTDHKDNQELQSEFVSQLKGLSPDLSTGLFFLRIPEYMINVGDLLGARNWLSREIPELTDTRDVHFAALLLARVLYLEGRIDQARNVLSQRFIQPLIRGVIPPFGEKGLVLFHKISQELGLTHETTQTMELGEKHYVQTLEFELMKRQNFGNETTPGTVLPFPTPVELLSGSQDLLLGLVTFTPLADSSVQNRSETFQTIQPIQGDTFLTDLPVQPEGRYIQIGNFTNQGNADRLKELAESRGYSVEMRATDQGIRILVPLGNQDPTTLQLLLRESGIEGFLVQE